MLLMRYLMLCLLLSSGAALAADDVRLSQRDEQLARRGDVVSVSEVMDYLQTHYYGRALAIEFERDDGLYWYEVSWLGPDNDLSEFTFNARSGELVKIKGVNIRRLQRDHP